MIRSFPAPPLSVVFSVFVNAPKVSAIESVSFPPPAFTTIRLNRRRSSEKSDVPFSPTSTWRTFLFPGRRRSWSFSPAPFPVSVSVPLEIRAL